MVGSHAGKGGGKKGGKDERGKEDVGKEKERRQDEKGMIIANRSWIYQRRVCGGGMDDKTGPRDEIPWNMNGAICTGI